MEKKIKSTNEKENKEMQNKKRVDRLSAYRNRIEELMECLEDIVDELDELQEEMEEDEHEGVRASDIPEIPFPPLDENGKEVDEDPVPQVNVTLCVFPEGKNYTLPIEMIRRLLDEH